MASFANDGGPLIALDLTQAPSWRGNAGSTSGDPIGPGSDYDLACEAGHPAALVRAGEGFGVVLGAQEGVSEAWWWQPAAESARFLVGAVFGDDQSDRHLYTMLIAELDIDWSPLGRIAIDGSRIVVFHAACEGGELNIDPTRNPAVIGDALSTSVAPGLYEVRAATVSVANEGLYNVVRFTPVI